MSRKPKLRKTPRERRLEAVDALHNGLCQTLTGVHLFANVLTRRAKKIDATLGKDMDELHTLIVQAKGECTSLLALMRDPPRAKPARKPRS